MKIAFILNRFPVLSETFILNQITGLIDRGHDVDIMASSSGNEEKMHPDVEKYGLLERTFYFGALYDRMPISKAGRILKAIYILKSRPEKGALLKSLNVATFGWEAVSLRNFYRLIPFLGKGPYDVIHCHFGPAGNLGAILKHAGVLDGNLITAFHGYDMTSYVREKGEGVYGFLFKTGDLFMPISLAWRDKLISMGCDENKICVHRMGLDTGSHEITPFRASHNGHVNVLSVARLVEKKGIKYGILAVAEVMQRHRNIYYTIAGDGPLKTELQELTQNIGIADRVRFLGWCNQAEIRAAMKDADILLAPSVTASNGDCEGIPVVLMEAMAQGMPVLSTKHSGIPELVEDGISGFIVPERDVDNLAERLEYLIEHPQIWPRMGRAGREFVEAKYDIDRLNDRLVEIYEQLVKGGFKTYSP